MKRHHSRLFFDKSFFDRSFLGAMSLAALLLLGCQEDGVTVSSTGNGDDGSDPDDQSGLEYVRPDLESCVGGETDLEELLCRHNETRTNVPEGQPIPDPELPMLTWDTGLQQVAQNYADQCIFEHNDDATDQYNIGTYVGENLFASSNSPTGLGVVTAWADDEAEHYDYATNSCDPGEVCGHYTQIVWRDTTGLGCGIAQCDSIDGVTFGGYLVVCNYAPGGNYTGVSPY